ncbi:MAG TPA: DUF6166 domain-containing protein [Thermoleophilaceae bacterium]|nr:DUF6166 domain-containing protein [Thermoleophilaceae bacterium]
MRKPEPIIYVGRLEDGAPAVYAVGGTAERLLPAGARIDWGAGDIDAATELARALILHAAGQDPSTEVARRFAEQVLSRMPRDGFALQCDTVNAWLRRVVTV